MGTVHDLRTGRELHTVPLPGITGEPGTWYVRRSDESVYYVSADGRVWRLSGSGAGPLYPPGTCHVQCDHLPSDCREARTWAAPLLTGKLCAHILEADAVPIGWRATHDVVLSRDTRRFAGRVYVEPGQRPPNTQLHVERRPHRGMWSAGDWLEDAGWLEDDEGTWSRYCAVAGEYVQESGWRVVSWREVGR